MLSSRFCTPLFIATALCIFSCSFTAGRLYPNRFTSRLRKLNPFKNALSQKVIDNLFPLIPLTIVGALALNKKPEPKNSPLPLSTLAIMPVSIPGSASYTPPALMPPPTPPAPVSVLTQKPKTQHKTLSAPQLVATVQQEQEQRAKTLMLLVPPAIARPTPPPIELVTPPEAATDASPPERMAAPCQPLFIAGIAALPNLESNAITVAANNCLQIQEAVAIEQRTTEEVLMKEIERIQLDTVVNEEQQSRLREEKALIITTAMRRWLDRKKPKKPCIAIQDADLTVVNTAIEASQLESTEPEEQAQVEALAQTEADATASALTEVCQSEHTDLIKQEELLVTAAAESIEASIAEQAQVETFAQTETNTAVGTLMEARQSEHTAPVQHEELLVTAAAESMEASIAKQAQVEAVAETGANTAASALAEICQLEQTELIEQTVPATAGATETDLRLEYTEPETQRNDVEIAVIEEKQAIVIAVAAAAANATIEASHLEETIHAAEEERDASQEAIQKQIKLQEEDASILAQEIIIMHKVPAHTQAAECPTTQDQEAAQAEKERLKKIQAAEIAAAAQAAAQALQQKQQQQQKEAEEELGKRRAEAEEEIRRHALAQETALALERYKKELELLHIRKKELKREKQLKKITDLIRQGLLVATSGDKATIKAFIAPYIPGTKQLKSLELKTIEILIAEIENTPERLTAVEALTHSMPIALLRAKVSSKRIDSYHKVIQQCMSCVACPGNDLSALVDALPGYHTMYLEPPFLSRLSIQAILARITHEKNTLDVYGLSPLHLARIITANGVDLRIKESFEKNFVCARTIECHCAALIEHLSEKELLELQSLLQDEKGLTRNQQNKRSLEVDQIGRMLTIITKELHRHATKWKTEELK